MTPVRQAFAAAGFAEVSRRSFDEADPRATLAVVRYDGPPVPVEPGQRWFSFAG